MKYYADRDADLKLLQVRHLDDGADAPEPLPGCTVHLVAGPWATVAPLEDMKAQARANVNDWWAAADGHSFVHQGYVIRSNAGDKEKLLSTNGIIMLTGQMPPDWVGVWKTDDDTLLPITTVAEWTALFTDFYMQGQTNYVRAQTLKAMIDACATCEDVLAITWQTEI